MTLAQIITTALLLASALNLALMIPGGPVETRDFSAYPLGALAAFNLFLTLLGLGSLALAWAVARHNVGFTLAMLAGLAYALVYIADIGRIFPVAPTPMPPLLARLEALGAALGGALAMIGGLAATNEAAGGSALPPAPRLGLIVVSVAGLAIVLFATRAAKGRK